jgi:glycosyltransferase involved in cell wall biosynthesis
MRILYHHRTQGKGVEGVHIREMIMAWKCKGHSVEIVSPPGVNFQEEARLDDSGFLKRINRHFSRYLPEIFFELVEIIYNLYAYKSVLQKLKETPCDFIYERYAIFNWSVVKAAVQLRIPVIIEVNYTSFTPLYRKRSRLLKPVAHKFDRWLFQNVDGIVVVSTYLKNHLINLGVDEKKITILTNAANPEVFSPKYSGIKVRERYGLNRKTVIGFVGGFYPWHGISLLLDAFELLFKDYNEAVLLLIGDGPMRRSLEKRISKLGLKNRVQFIGYVSHNQLPEYIAAFDIAVMPNSNEYGSPMKIYEYMAMSKPVVAPSFVPLKDGINHSVEGLLFEPENTDELVHCLEKLIIDPSLRVRMGKYGRKRILTIHNWDNNAESVIIFLKELKGKTEEPYRESKPEQLSITL